MNTEVLVIGGGPAGSAAAIQLARGGAQVTLVERERLPAHKVCGEFLSAEALHYLRQLGLDPSALGAVPLTTVRFTGNQDSQDLCAPRNPLAQPLPFAAMSLTRRCLDAELLRRAELAGAHVRRGCSVEQLTRTGNTWQAALAGGETITAREIFLASGKHDLRGHPRPAGRQQGMVAFKMYWRLQPGQMSSLGHAVELITYQGGYAGLQPAEDGIANLCCLVHAGELRRIGQWPGLIDHMCRQSPHLRSRLHGAEPLLAKPLTIASLPYGFVRQTSEGPWHLGDQAVVIPSFTGDGTSLALHTGILAADMYLRGQTPHQYQQTIARQVHRQVAIATTVSRMMVRAPSLVRSLLQLWPGAMNLTARLTRIAPSRIARQLNPPATAVCHTHTGR